MTVLPYGDRSGGSPNLSRFTDVVAGGARPETDEGGSSLGGALVRGLVAPLQIIDTPRRAIISGLRELVDAVDNDPTTKASLSDFGSQTMDTSYGFGTAFADPTGNQFLDRVIGFAGDVALDPLTYLGLGAGKFAGATGRATAGKNLLTAARAVDRVDDAAPLISAVGKKGVIGLTDQQRALYDDIIRAGREAGVEGSELGRAGLRFRVPFTGRQTAAIPGTRRIAEGTGRALSGARQGIGNTRLGRNITDRITPEANVGLMRALRSGDQGRAIRELENSIGMTAEAVERGVKQSQGREAVDVLVRNARREGVSGEDAAREIASGNPTTEAGRALSGFFDEGFKDLRDAGSEIQYRKNYLPRMLTDDGIALQRGDVGEEVAQTIGVVDELSPEGITLRRTRIEGSELKRGDRTVTLKGDDPFSFNEAMRELYPELGDNNFVIEDGFDLANRWADAAASEHGRLAYARRLAEIGSGVDTAVDSSVIREGRILRGIEDQVRDPQRIEGLEAATRTSRQEAYDAARDTANAARRAETRIIQEEVDRLRRSAGNSLRRANVAWRNAQRRVAQIRGEVDKIDDRIAKLRNQNTASARRQLKARTDKRKKLLKQQSDLNVRAKEIEDLLIEREALENLIRTYGDAGRTAVPGLGEAPGRGSGRLFTSQLNQVNRRITSLERRIADESKRIGDELGALPKGGAGIVPDQSALDEIEYLENQRTVAEGVNPFADRDVQQSMDTSRQFEIDAENAENRAIAIGSRDPMALDLNRRTGAARRRTRKAQAEQTAAKRQLDAANDEGFTLNLDGVDTTARLTTDVRRLPDKGNRRFKREVRALTEDVPEGELLNRDERYLADLRRRAQSGDQAAEVGYASILNVYATEARIAAEGAGEARRFGNFFDDISKGKNSVKFREDMLNQLEQGWRQIEGTGVAVPEQLYVIRQRILELNKPEVYQGFLKAWQAYTRVFKAYVTATPRFHIRNGMSASFMNFSDGVRPDDMIEGIRIWNKYRSSGMDALNADEKFVIDSVLGSGAGQYDAVEVGLKAPPGTGWSRRMGRNVEGTVRAAPAVATLREGGSLEEAVTRITRLHFNYSQFSSNDRIFRQIFPFWTFMSRNLPLQVTQMWSKPRSYQKFNSFVRNIRSDDEETGVVPDYFLEGGGFRLPFRVPGVGQYARPDLGFSRVEEDVDRMADPIRFLADSNPLIKAVVENFAGKQLYKDIPLDDESFVRVEGWQQALLPLLTALGQTESMGGETFITPKTEYLLDQVNPLGGLINRYAGEGSRNEEKAVKNLLSALGYPTLFSLGGYVRDLTPEVQQSAMKREQFEQRDLMRKMRELAEASAS